MIGTRLVLATALVISAASTGVSDAVPKRELLRRVATEYATELAGAPKGKGPQPTAKEAKEAKQAAKPAAKKDAKNAAGSVSKARDDKKKDMKKSSDSAQETDADEHDSSNDDKADPAEEPEQQPTDSGTEQEPTMEVFKKSVLHDVKHAGPLRHREAAAMKAAEKKAAEEKAREAADKEAAKKAAQTKAAEEKAAKESAEKAEKEVVADKDASIPAEVPDTNQKEKVVADKDASISAEVPDTHQKEKVVADKDASVPAEVPDINQKANRVEQVIAVPAVTRHGGFQLPPMGHLPPIGRAALVSKRVTVRKHVAEHGTLLEEDGGEDVPDPAVIESLAQALRKENDELQHQIDMLIEDQTVAHTQTIYNPTAAVVEQTQDKAVTTKEKSQLALLPFARILESNVDFSNDLHKAGHEAVYAAAWQKNPDEVLAELEEQGWHLHGPHEEGGTVVASLTRQGSLIQMTAEDRWIGGSPHVRCDTSRGSFLIKVDQHRSPIGAKRLLQLVENDFFKDNAIFRAVDGFGLQFGISNDAEANAKWDATILDDTLPAGESVSFPTGTVIFAGNGENSRTTQLFIATADLPQLGANPWEIPVGHVVQQEDVWGDNVLQQVYTGYGESVDQNLLRQTGTTYLQRHFPKLDYIKNCVAL